MTLEPEIKQCDVADATVQKATLRKIMWWVILCAGVTIAGLLGTWWFLESRIVEVETRTVVAADLSIVVTASGTIQAADPVDVYARIEGIVADVPVVDGQKVSKGQTLLELDSQPYDVQLLAAESALAQARNGLAQATASSAGQGSAIEAANAAITAAQMGVDLAYDYKKRADEEVADIQRELDHALAKTPPNPEEIEELKGWLFLAEGQQREAAVGISSAEAEVAAARSALAQAQSGNAAPAIEAANAAIVAAEGQVSLARRALSDAVITAPIAGKLLFAPTALSSQSLAAGAGNPLAGSTLMVGSAIGPGVPLFTIVDPASRLFVAEIHESDIIRIEKGQNAVITLESYAEETFEGTITKIASVAQTTRTGGTVFPVEIFVDVRKKNLSLGMKGDADIEISRQEVVTTIPLQALFSEGGDEFVYRAIDDRLVRTAVVTGERTDDSVEVVRGLIEGATVVLASNLSFEDGMRVRPIAR